MKLFTKYNRINLIATISIFLLVSVSFYFLINYIVINQVDEDLKIEQREIQSYVLKHDHLPETVPVRDQMISFTPAASVIAGRKFRKLILLDSVEKERNTFRQLNFSIKVKGQIYSVSIAKSLETTDNLIHSLVLITFGVILLILVTSFIINRIVLKRLWKPFYETLDTIKLFKVNKKANLTFPETNINEFQIMKETLVNTTAQARSDYLLLKEFTENASHEMQTPLAVIRSKLDLLIQNEDITEPQSQILQVTYNAIQKLTRLNQSLLLLAKIENRQYEEKGIIDMELKIKEKVKEFNELWNSQELKIYLETKPENVCMNDELADIMLNNLFSNATKHNFTGGEILIDLTDENLSIKNTSQELPLDETKLFSRFYKPSAKNENNGLGLSIIKQICEVSGFSVNYSYKNKFHIFSISWNK